MAKKTATTNRRSISKTEFFNAIVDECEEEVTRKQVAAVFAAQETVLQRQLGRRGPGVINIPSLIKIVKKDVPARKAKKNVPNPFKPGETMDVKARPATVKVKVLPLKRLKEMV